jgi:hypothetical protein
MITDTAISVRTVVATRTPSCQSNVT